LVNQDIVKTRIPHITARQARRKIWRLTVPQRKDGEEAIGRSLSMVCEVGLSQYIENPASSDFAFETQGPYLGSRHPDTSAVHSLTQDDTNQNATS
jgi:hypothetical protein